jgi:hypothetical protein
LGISTHLKINIMPKGKEVKEKSQKKEAVKSLKEKRADKALKRKNRSDD